MQLLSNSHISASPFNLNEHLNDTFLVGGYRVKKGQLKWILGQKPERDHYLYNVRFSPCRQSCRDGAPYPSLHPQSQQRHQQHHHSISSIL